MEASGIGMTAPWQRHFHKAARSGAYLLAHLLVSMVIVAMCAIDAVPLRYVFDAIGLGILVMFLVFGTREAWPAFAEDLENDDE